jgi:hypothetical protein
MNMWQEGIPRNVAWYVCAWPKGDEYVYSVGRWNGTSWETPMTAAPVLYQEIQSPRQQWDMIDELHKAK